MELGSKDPHFTYHVQADKEGRINALMWANGDSRLVQKKTVAYSQIFCL